MKGLHHGETVYWYGIQDKNCERRISVRENGQGIQQCALHVGVEELFGRF